MTKKVIPPTDCKVCGKPNCNDWMYKAGLVAAEQAICGECKQNIGLHVLKKIAVLMWNEVEQKRKKKNYKAKTSHASRKAALTKSKATRNG